MTHIYSSKRTVALFMTLMAVMTIAAAPRSVEQARQEAAQLMKKHTSQKVNGKNGATASGPKLVFTKAKKNTQADEVAYYVFSSGNNLGYTIVSGDDRLPAIVGYTESGDYDTELLPDNLKSFMQAYQEFAETATDEQIAEIKAWKANSSNTHAAVAPFMEETWNQTAPYNNLCPEYQYYGEDGTVQSNRAVTGCVATAIAQILHYYGCPKQLLAEIPAYTTNITVYNTQGKDYENTISLDAIPANETYDWANMLNEYTGNESTTQNDAVAKLMLHAGCAVQMSYGPSSGASAAPETFTKFFGMDKELIKYCNRKNYQIAQWDELLYEEMANKRPVYYSGQSTGGGHAFVIQGYSTDGLYYVNWGWGGYCNGYFDITILNPNSTSGAGASSSEDGYAMDNSMIIGIKPDNGAVDNLPSPMIASTVNLSLSNERISENTLSGTITANPQNINLHEKVFVSVGYKNDNGKYINVSNNPCEIQADQLGFGWSFGLPLNISFPIEEGKTYKLCLIESTDKENWTACEGEDATALTIKIENGDYTIITDSGDLTATATLNAGSGGYAGMSNTIDITVTNSGNKEYYDKVYVRVSNSEDMPGEDTFTQGITAPVNGSTTFNFAYTPATAGTYNFWILDVTGKETGKEIGKSSIEFKEAEAPVLSFVSIKCTNASEDKYNNIDKVYDTKATFEFIIKNEGGFYEGPFGIFDKYNAGTFSGPIKTLTIPNNTTQTFTFTVEGNIGETVGVMLQSRNSSVELEGYKLCYLAGAPEYTRTDNITSGNWNTICLPFNCNVPNDVTVEEFSEINGDKVIFTSVTQMTAGTAYIFKANGNDVNFTSENGKTENINDIEKTEGTFIGVLSKTITFNDDFREEGYTYYGINPTDNEFQRLGTAATCTPYHAYLKVKDETAQAQALKVIHGGGDGTTGISNITDNEKPQVIYNINGQRITTPQKGINIINGRKVIIK